MDLLVTLYGFAKEALPEVTKLLFVASAVAHWWMIRQHKANHKLLIDSVAQAVGDANKELNASAPSNVTSGGGA